MLNAPTRLAASEYGKPYFAREPNTKENFAYRTCNIRAYCLFRGLRHKQIRQKQGYWKFMAPHPNFNRLLKENCKVSLVSTRHLTELQQEIEGRRNKGEFDEEFSREYLPRFKFALPPELADAQSLIVVAMPRPPTQATFIWKGKSHSFILPPTYTAYDEKRIYIERAVAEDVGKAGYKIATAMLPLKLLAVRSGLA